MSAQPLIEYLEQLQAKGETHISIDERARHIMRQFYIKCSKAYLGTTPSKDSKPETKPTKAQP